MSLRISGAVVVDPIKVLYAPVPKAACTSLKRLLAEAAGTYDESALLRLTTPNITPEQAIHQPEVNGFTYFRNLEDDEQASILSSAEWWRLAAVRNPYARAYSAFEGNLLLFAGTMETGIAERYEEVIVDGRLDLTETFDRFVRSLADHRLDYFTNDHFRPQLWQVSPDVVEYTHFLRVDEPGAMAGFAAALASRSGRAAEPRRMNEGLGLRYRDVMSAPTARLIEDVYSVDFAALGYPREEFPETVEHRLLTPQETRLVHQVQRMWVRQWQMSVAALGMRGFRYGLGQVTGRLGRAARGRRA